MKKLLFSLFLALSSFSLVLGQGIYFTFTPEGVQSAIENTELLLSDPLLNQAATYQSPGFKQQKSQAAQGAEGGGFTGFTIGVETEVSKNTKSLSLPLNYYWRNFNLGLTLPYIYQRKMIYALETKEASGIGDIAVSAGYTGGISSLLFSFNVYSKLPTGDEEKVVEGYLVPLGTGSTDWVVNLAALKSFKRLSIHGSGFYKINGASQRIAEVVHTQGIETIDYEIHNGDMLSITGGFDLALSYSWILGLWGSYTSVGEGSTDAAHSFDYNEPSYTVTGISNKQDMTLVDIIPNISWSLSGFDLSLFLKIPVVTERNEDNNEGDRNLTVIFKLGRTL